MVSAVRMYPFDSMISKAVSGVGGKDVAQVTVASI